MLNIFHSPNSFKLTVPKNFFGTTKLKAKCVIYTEKHFEKLDHPDRGVRFQFLKFKYKLWLS